MQADEVVRQVSTGAGSGPGASQLPEVRGEESEGESRSGLKKARVQGMFWAGVDGCGLACGCNVARELVPFGDC